MFLLAIPISLALWALIFTLATRHWLGAVISLAVAMALTALLAWITRNHPD